MLCAGAWWLQSNKLRDLDTRIAADEKRQRDLQAIAAQVAQFQQKKAILENKVLVIEQLRLAQKSPVHMLDEISKALPDYVWLTTLDETQGNLRFAGQSNSLAAVADYISALQRSGWFPAVDLGTSQEAAEPRELHARGRLQGPGGRRQGKGDRRGQGRGRPGRRPGRPVPGREPGKEGGPEMADNPLTKLPLAGQLGVSAVIAALICGGFYYFWYSDALEQQRQKETRLADLQKQIRALEATANRLPEFQREVQALEARLETLKRILPPEKEMPDLMRRIQYLAAQSSLSIRKFNPAPVVTKDFYQEVPVSIDVEGTYHNMGAFLDRVSRMSRLVNMSDLKIKAQSTQTLNNTIAVTSTATTYVYLDNVPPPGAGARPEAAGTRRGTMKARFQIASLVRAAGARVCRTGARAAAGRTHAGGSSRRGRGPGRGGARDAHRAAGRLASAARRRARDRAATPTTRAAVATPS